MRCLDGMSGKTMMKAVIASPLAAAFILFPDLTVGDIE